MSKPFQLRYVALCWHMTAYTRIPGKPGGCTKFLTGQCLFGHPRDYNPANGPTQGAGEVKVMPQSQSEKASDDEFSPIPCVCRLMCPPKRRPREVARPPRQRYRPITRSSCTPDNLLRHIKTVQSEQKRTHVSHAHTYRTESKT
jgi:hypothetical protein